MTRFIIAAAALAIATPVLADQPRSVLDVRQHFAADEGGNDAVIFTDGVGITARSASIHSMLAANQDMANQSLVPSAADLLDPNSGIVNATAARILKQLDAEDPNS